MESWQEHWSSFVMISIFLNFSFFLGGGGDLLNILKLSCPFTETLSGATFICS